jgi:hypothetical protein
MKYGDALALLNGVFIKSQKVFKPQNQFGLNGWLTL